MSIDPKEAALASGLLWPGEHVEETAKQRSVGPGGSVTAPTSVICTNMRIIIVNRATLGLRKDYEVIPYKQITSVRLEHGLVSSSVFIRVQGYDRDKGLLKDGREEGEIDGLHNGEAAALADYINKKISAAAEAPQPSAQNAPAQGQADSTIGAYVYCTNCGSKDKVGAKFCQNCGAKLS